MSNCSKINLLQMQHYFEGQIDNIHTISDLELSENDYRSLGAKLSAFSFFSGSENDIEEYILSIVVYSTYTLIYGQNVDDFETVIRMLLKKSQYAERLRLIMYRDAFYNYGLNLFECDKTDLRKMCQEVTAIHAGIPNVDKNAFFELMSDCLEISEVDCLYDKIYEHLPKRTKFIFDFMREEVRRDLLFEMRTMVSEVVDGIYRRDELIARYKRLSISLIDRCIMWNENHNQQIRYGIT